MRGYRDALETAGAVVLAFETFGSYQGDWWAKVSYGGTGWVHGYYGSCSVCDGFLSEFGYSSHACIEEDYYDPIYGGEFFDECETCQRLKERYIQFGQEYLSQMMSYEDAVEKASENLEWDFDAQEMVDFIKDNK